MVAGTARVAVGSAAWWEQRVRRRERTARRRSQGLTAERITGAALAYIDEHGLEALTVRRLARELGTGHASLYRHIESRDALLIEVFDHALAEIEVPTGDLPWREHCERIADELRRVLRAHPALMRVIGASRLIGPNALALSNATVKPLLDQGVPPALAARSFFTVVTYVVGVTILDFSVAAPSQVSEVQRELLAVSASAPYPALATIVRATDVLDDEGFVDFEFGLRSLLDGLERAAATAIAAG